MRIAIGGISHETSTFAPVPTRLGDFETGLGLYRGQDIVERFRGTNNCTGGFITGAERHGFDLVPLLWTFAYPGGLIEHAAYQALKGDFLDRLDRAVADGGPVDGVLLDQHGAMVVAGIDDADGDFSEAVRAAVGPACPIIVTFDLHGNHARRRLDAATAVIGFDTYPHVDMADRGVEAAMLMVRTVRGAVRPVMAFRELPLFWSAACQVTAHPPIDEAFRLVHEVEQRPGILSVTLATGFPWADVPQMSASVIAVADGDRALARATADEIGDWVWQRRDRWHRRPLSVSEALDLGERAGRYPIMLADMADKRAAAHQETRRKCCGRLSSATCTAPCCCISSMPTWPGKRMPLASASTSARSWEASRIRSRGRRCRSSSRLWRSPTADSATTAPCTQVSRATWVCPPGCGTAA